MFIGSFLVIFSAQTKMMKRASSSAAGDFSDESMCYGTSLRSILALAMNHDEAATPLLNLLPPLPASLDLDFSPSIFNLIGGEGGGDRLVQNESTQLYDFFPKVSGDSAMVYEKLPDLNSLERSELADSETLESVVRSSLRRPISAGGSSDLTCPAPLAPVTAATSLSQRIMERNRRRKVTDRFRSLQKLMPWSKKMDATTMLEEVLRYVKFLQSQVVALRSMPREPSPFFDQPVVYGRIGGAFWRLEEVSRRKLLEVLVNSPRTQSVLYSRELCVFSVEQIVAASQPVARPVPYGYRY